MKAFDRLTFVRKREKVAFDSFHQKINTVLYPAISTSDRLLPLQHVQDHRELEGLVAGIREVEEMFSENIVQGRLNEAGNYEVRLRPEVHLKGKEHEMVTHVDDRLVGDTVVVERSRAPRDGSAPGGSCQSGKG